MGFSGLRQFGPGLIHHTCLKVRKDINTTNFMMVDSPGMIDSPISHGSLFDSYTDSKKSQFTPHKRSFPVSNLGGRGYDFESVVKWFAERADVILLFFDPDKPGTTGETLSTLTNSLPGLDHKLYIILNKADKFEKIHDFARAFGSLCWNLSKVIQRKDLPRVYTMCLPESSIQDHQNDGMKKSGLKDLEVARNAVLEEVFKAPKRRIDNIITRLTDSVHMLQVHATIVHDLKAEYSRAKWGHRGTIFSVLATGTSLSGLSVYAKAPVQASLALSTVSLLLSSGIIYISYKNLISKEKFMTSVEGLNTRFEMCYASRLAEGDEMIHSVWKRIRDGLKLTLGTSGMKSIANVKAYELKELERILENDIPSLRRSAAPVQFSHTGVVTNSKVGQNEAS